MEEIGLLFLFSLLLGLWIETTSLLKKYLKRLVKEKSADN